MPSITSITTQDVRFPTSLELDGSDAVNVDPDYSAAYVVIRTDAGDEGHGFVFSCGRGSEILTAAIESYAGLLRGRDIDELIYDLGNASKRLIHDSQLRWLGPEKGVIHLATAAVVAVPLAGVYYEMVRPLPFPPPPLSSQNNYNRIEAICIELGSAINSRGRPLKEAELRALVDEAVTLLEAPNFLPTVILEEEALSVYPRRVNARDLYTFPSHLDTAARTAGHPGNYDRAADYSFAGLRYGELFHRGGTAGHASFASGLQGRSLQWLAEHRDHVSPAKAREVVQAIEQTFSQRDDFATLIARDLIAWERKSGWMGRLKYRLSQWFPHELPGNSLKDEYLASCASLRALQTVYAIRLFQDDHRRLPHSLAELTPDYLHTVPLDPYSDSPLIYRPAEDDFELYSVGRDRTDNGGKFDAIKYYRESGFDLDVSWNDRHGAQ